MRYLMLFAMLAAVLVRDAGAQETRAAHPDITKPDWVDLFEPDLSNAIVPEGVWYFTDGVLTADEDEVIWSERSYDRFVLDLEFKNAPGTNSGVIVYASDLDNWVPNSVEIQIADDYAEQWANAPASWRSGAVFGHLPPNRQMVREPGAWNRYTITCRDDSIKVVLNGALVTEMDLKQWTSATHNPDGSDIPEWLNRPLAELPTHGHIGLQGKHGGAPIWFRNIRVKELP